MRRLHSLLRNSSLLMLGLGLVGGTPNESFGYGWPCFPAWTTYSGPMAPGMPVMMSPTPVASGMIPTTNTTPPPYAGPMAPTYPGYSYPGYSYPGYSHPGYSYPGYSHPGYSYPGYSYPGYSYPGYSYPGYAYPNTAQPTAPQSGGYSYLADFDPKGAPIVAPIPGSSAPISPALVSLGVQLLGDVATQWFSGAATDKNSLFQNALNIFKQRTNQSSSAQPTSTDIQKLLQIVERVIGSVAPGGAGGTGGVTSTSGPPGPSSPITNQGGGDTVTFTVTAPASSGVTGVTFQYGKKGAASEGKGSAAGPPATETAPPAGQQQQQPVNQLSPSGPPGNP
jgi:hypothetical protein